MYLFIYFFCCLKSSPLEYVMTMFGEALWHMYTPPLTWISEVVKTRPSQQHQLAVISQQFFWSQKKSVCHLKTGCL